MKLSVCKQKWHLNCKIWMHIPASPQKDRTKDRDLHFYVYMLLSVSTEINFGILYDLKWSKLLCDIKSTIYYILAVKWKYLIKIVGNSKDFRNLSSHWKIVGRSASGLSMVLEAKLQNFGMYSKATGPDYELLVQWPISVQVYNWQAIEFFWRCEVSENSKCHFVMNMFFLKQCMQGEVNKDCSVKERIWRKEAAAQFWSN